MVYPLFKTNKPLRSHIYRVMVVDDHEIYRNGLRDLMDAREHFRVVAEGRQCKDTLDAVEKQPIDLIIMDRFLPDGDALLTIPKVKQVAMETEVIVLSSSLDEESVYQALKIGAVGYLTKDTPVSEMLEAFDNFEKGEFALISPVAAFMIRYLLQRCSDLELHVRSSLQFNLDTFRQALPLPTVVPPFTEEQLKALTPRERRVFQFLSKGYSNKQIAAQLAISPYTVGKHVQHILHKLGVSNRTQAVSYTSFKGGAALKG